MSSFRSSAQFQNRLLIGWLGKHLEESVVHLPELTLTPRRQSSTRRLTRKLVRRKRIVLENELHLSG